MSAAVTWGSLPNGLTIDERTGFISGVPTEVGAFSAQITFD